MKKLFFNAGGIRAELYKVRDQLLEFKGGHIAAWRSTKEGHSTPCRTCESYDNQVLGVDFAIRHFKGGPR